MINFFDWYSECMLNNFGEEFVYVCKVVGS